MMATTRDLRLGRCAIGKLKKSNNFDSKQQQVDDKSKKKKQKQKKKHPEVDFEVQEQQIKEGDIVNLSDLLFTKKRDYLIKYNNDLKSSGYCLTFCPFSSMVCRFEATNSILGGHIPIHPKGGFQVVFVAVTYVPPGICPELLLNSTPKEFFQEKFSFMPWTAIPFDDIESRKYLETRFPISHFLSGSRPVSFVIDPTGVVLQCQAESIFLVYGAQAYPFSDNTISQIKSEDEDARKHTFLKKLLVFPERDHIISNKGKQVVRIPVHDLEDKVVALYFYQDYPIDSLTKEIQAAYEQLANKENFEIVLVYVHGSWDFLNVPMKNRS
ncbi:hypothetical protein OROGR_015432 [Orobanche gracilis]